MPDRTLTTEWPEYFNSTGEPDNGTIVDEALLDAMRDAVDESIYADELDEGPPEIAREVVEARPGYPNLKARLDAIAALAAGGNATAGSGGLINLITNDSFLVWSSTLPDRWARSNGDLAVTRETAQGYAYPIQMAGRSFVKLVNSSGAARDFYIDVVPAGSLTAYGGVPIKQAAVAGGIFISTDTTGLVEVYVDDGVGAQLIGENDDVISQPGNPNWVWSASKSQTAGGVTLAAAPTRLRFIVRLTGNGTAYVAGACLGFGDSCPRYSPAPVRHGQVLWGVDAGTLPTTGVKATFRFPAPTYVYQAEAYCTTAPAGAATVCTVKNTGAAIFSGFEIPVGQTASGLKAAGSVALGSFGDSSILTLEPTSVDAATRGLTISVRYLQYVDPVAALFGAGVAVT